MKRRVPLTLHPLTFDEALANLIAVKPKGKKKPARKVKKPSGGQRKRRT